MTSAPAAATAGRSPHRRRTHCRACDRETLERFLELGPQPLANSFLRSPADFAGEPKFPLDVYLCPTCGLVQLADVIDPETLFREYIYVTGTSSTIAAHNIAYAATVSDLLQLGPDDLVVEVASNDGSLLARFRDLGTRTLGIEPARNIAAMATARGIDTVAEFFDSTTARDVRRRAGPARAVIGNNVLAHVDDPRDFLTGAAELLSDDGLVITEVPYLREFVDRLEYDTVYHEHLCYFSVSALLALCDAVGLAITRVDRVPVHGGSIRMYAGRAERLGRHAVDVLDMAAAEARDGLTSLPAFLRFGEQARAQRTALLGVLHDLRRRGKRVAGYGAPAKGNTLLNYCGITPDLVEYTVDRNPLKVGRYTPGTHLPVRAYETIAADRPDYLLLLAWNFADEIMRQPQESLWHDRGGRFILPLPEPRIV